MKIFDIILYRFMLYTVQKCISYMSNFALEVIYTIPLINIHVEMKPLEPTFFWHVPILATWIMYWLHFKMSLNLWHTAIILIRHVCIFQRAMKNKVQSDTYSYSDEVESTNFHLTRVHIYTQRSV